MKQKKGNLMIFFLHLQMAALSSQLSLTSFHPYAFPSYKKMVTMIMILILAEDHKDCLAYFNQCNLFYELFKKFRTSPICHFADHVFCL